MAESKDKKQVALESGFIAVQHTHEIAGPLPSAEELLRYKEVIPDLPERIVRQFEEDSEHGREQQRRALDADIAFDKRSQDIAALIIMAGYVIAALLAYIGADAVAFVSALGSTMMIFKGTFSRKRDSK